MKIASDARPLVAHVVYRFAIGGLENIVAALINRMPAYRHAVISLTDVTNFRWRIHVPDVDIIALHKPPGHAIRLYPALLRYFNNASPSIVHTCNLAALEAAVPAWFARVPVRIHAEHGWDIHDRDGSIRKYKLLRRAYRPFVTHYIAVSAQLSRYLCEAVGIARTNVSLIYNGVDIERFSPRSDPGLAEPMHPFSNPRCWIVGTVGRMQTVKNQTLLARAFIRAIQLKPDAAATLRLVMVGDGPLRDECSRILADADLHHLAWLPGESDRTPQLMQGMSCFVLPSTTEGTSCTILEAMATSLPVIATNVGGNADIVSDGVTGTIVPSDDVDALASAILTYWRHRDMAKHHGIAGRARIEKAFEVDQMVTGYNYLFKSLLNRSNNRAVARVVQ